MTRMEAEAVISCHQIGLEVAPHKLALAERMKYTLAGETKWYRDSWEMIADDHYPECPTAIAANAKRPSTLCYCKELESAQ